MIYIYIYHSKAGRRKAAWTRRLTPSNTLSIFHWVITAKRVKK